MSIRENNSRDINEDLISVIVPAYNSADTLDRCVRSLIFQSYANLDIIIVNDGSSDNTLEIAKNLSKLDSRVRVINQKNAGLSGARNTGLDNAWGNLVFFLDSDDYIEKNEIRSLSQALASSNADLAVGGLVYESSHGDKERTISVVAGVVDEMGYWERAYGGPSSDYAEYIVACGKLFRKAVFTNERFDEGKLHEDEYIIHRLLAHCSHVVFVDNPSYFYVQHERSIMHNEGVNSILDAVEAILMRTHYFLSKSWFQFAWPALLYARELLVRALAGEATKDECERRRALIGRWREMFRIAFKLGRCPVGRAASCALFFISPSLFASVSRVIRGR